MLTELLKQAATARNLKGALLSIAERQSEDRNTTVIKSVGGIIRGLSDNNVQIVASTVVRRLNPIKAGSRKKPIYDR